jgi:DNA-binding NtrC family response regulator
MRPSILLVDDDGGLLTLLTSFFGKRGWDVERAATGQVAVDRFRFHSPDLVLLDLELPDIHGISVLRRLREEDPGASVVVLTATGDVEMAVEAMRLGAANFLTKPVELHHLAEVAERAESARSLRLRNRRLSSSDPVLDNDELGPSPLMREIAGRVERIGAADGTVLLKGETGTGKGWVARRIHDASARRDRPFVAVSCGSLDTTVLDAELFGHEQGAFADARSRKEGLFEVADGGTIFLDEVGDLSSELQPKLLEVLEHSRFRRLGGTDELTADVRLIAATHQDLRERFAEGSFREDLYYRLAVLPLELPPLRDRTGEDIATLAYRLLNDLRDRIDKGPRGIDDEALALLSRYSWPGNIRELRNLLERILILAGDDDVIRPAHIPAELRQPPAPNWERGDTLTLEEVERRHIARVLELNDGNRSRSARALGISRAALYDKMDRYKLRAVGR